MSTAEKIEAGYARWARRLAEQAFAKADAGFQDEPRPGGMDWRDRRGRAAWIAKAMMDRAVKEFAVSQRLSTLPFADFERAELADPANHLRGHGILRIGEVRAEFWPVWRVVDYTDSDVDIQPKAGSGVSAAHKAKRAATLLLGGVAEKMIGRKAAKELFVRWVQDAAAQAKAGGGPWPGARARYEREFLGSTTGQAAPAPERRSRL